MPRPAPYLYYTTFEVNTVQTVFPNFARSLRSFPERTDSIVLEFVRFGFNLVMQVGR